MSNRNYYSVFNRYYKVLIRIPSTKFMLILMLIVFGLSYLFMKSTCLIFIYYFLVLTICLIIYTRVFVKSVFYRFKRILFLTLFTLVYSLLVFMFTNILISIISSIVILIIAIQSLDGNNIYRYFVCTIPLYVTSVTLYVFGIFSKEEVVFTIIGSIVLIIIDYFIYVFLSRYKFNGFKSVDLATMYMWNWLEKRNDIEDVFLNLSIGEKIYPCLLKTNSTVIIYTDIHYGPFSNTGSSELPRKLSLFFGDMNLNSIVLHGLGSHERNLSHSKYIDSLLQVFEKLYYEKGIGLKYHGLFKIMNNEWELTCIVFSNISLIIVSRPGRGIEDLPYSLQRDLQIKALDRNLGRVIIIDAHNWVLESNYDTDSLEKLLFEALDYIDYFKKNEPVDVLIKSTCVERNLPGVIDGEICLLELMGVDGRGRLILVYFRGNNIEPNLRNELINYIREKTGSTNVEVLSNDEHSETGVYARTTYIPVKKHPHVFEAIDGLINDLKNKSFDNQLYYSETSLNCLLMGENVYKLVELLNKTYPAAFVSVIGYVVLSPFLILLLQFIL
ncbi:MAG: DUF2070 family protein [Desulfurococcaceae archaeon]